MKSKSWMRWLGVTAAVLVLVSVGWFLQRAQAQTGGGGFAGNMGFSSSYTLYPAAITEKGGHLYVVHGNTLYKYNADNLKQEQSVALSPPPQSVGFREGFSGGQ